MDTRVQELFDWVRSQEVSVDPVAVRARIVPLHAEVNDEADRVSLIALYCAVTNAGERELVRLGRDLQPLLDARTADLRTFCLVEAMGENDLVNPVELDRVITREIAAGRMAEDDFAELARSGAAVLGEPPRKRPSIFQRLFG